MTNSESTNQTLITTHAVLVGLTPLIPIPLIDDLAKSYFQRRLVRKLATAYGHNLSSKDVKTLADDPDSGCLWGCLGMIFLYPIKKIFRKIFFFLEWKRAIDIVSRTYHQGYLIECVLQEQWLNPIGPRNAAEVRTAIDTVCREINTNPIERAVSGTFNQSKEVLKGAADLLKRSLQGIMGKPSEESVAQAAEAIEAEEERELGGVVSKLQKAIQNVPSEHFQGMRSRLKSLLGSPIKRN
jgi:hypothetical protein